MEQIIARAFTIGLSQANATPPPAPPPATTTPSPVLKFLSSTGIPTHRLKSLVGLPVSEATLALNLVEKQERSHPEYHLLKLFQDDFLSFLDSAGYLDSDGSIAWEGFSSCYEMRERAEQGKD